MELHQLGRDPHWSAFAGSPDGRINHFLWDFLLAVEEDQWAAFWVMACTTEPRRRIARTTTPAVMAKMVGCKKPSDRDLRSGRSGRQ